MSLRSRRWSGDDAYRGVVAAAAAAVFLVVALIVYEAARGSELSIRAFGLDFLTSTRWDPVEEKFGALPYIWGTLVTSVIALALASYELGGWLPGLVIWWAKPWLDRTILFVLSRAAFGQHTTPGDVWRAQRQVWWKQFLFTWTVRRVSLWRSLTEPVYQLEGLSIGKAGDRVHQIRHRNAGVCVGGRVRAAS